jgi:hypothetical protein
MKDSYGTYDGRKPEPPYETGPTDPALDAALAWADQLRAHDFDDKYSRKHAHTLAAAVRDRPLLLQAANELIAAWQTRCSKAEADLAALKGRTCATCRFARLDWRNELRHAYCHYLSDGKGIVLTMCHEVGFTCGAWAAKEGA